MRKRYIVTFEEYLDKEQLGCALRAIGMIRGVDEVGPQFDARYEDAPQNTKGNTGSPKFFISTVPGEYVELVNRHFWELF